jgi:GPH family glycoside/pentoside/hexuronide:cation symporter
MKLSIRVGYGVGQLSAGINMVAFNTFLFFYYNQVLGLSGSLAGAAALIALIVDAVTDPMVGQISDRFRSRWGRRHPFMLAGALFYGLALYILFCPPSGMGEYGIFSWMLGWAIVTRVLLTLFFIPHLSLGAEIVKDYHERTALIGYRVFFAYLGALLLSIIGFTLFFPKTETFANGMLNGANYPAFGLFAGLVASVAMLWSVFATRSSIPFLSKPVLDPDARHPLLAFITVFSTLRLHSFRVLFFSILIFMTMVGVTQTLLVYNASYLFGFSPEQLAIIISAPLIGILFAPTVSNKMSLVFDKKKALIISVLLGAIFGFLPILMYLGGQFQLLSMNGKMILVFCTGGISQGFFMSYNIIFDSMLSDTIDEHESITGRREEGLFFAARSFAVKSCFGFGTLFTGIALDVIHFPKGANPENVPLDALANLAIIAGPVSMVLMLTTIVTVWRYPIHEARHSEILEEINQKKESTPEELKIAPAVA